MNVFLNLACDRTLSSKTYIYRVCVKLRLEQLRGVCPDLPRLSTLPHILNAVYNVLDLETPNIGEF